jgi:LytS/YehU family sensor histidine kinase
MIEGYEKEWTTGSTRQVVYANLPMGKYKFLLRAGKSNSPWSKPIEYEIIVKAIYYQHPIFYIGLSLFIAGLISWWVIYRKNLQMRKREMEHQLVTLEQKALQSMMNPHFLFNALGSIQNFLLQNKSHEAGLFLARFASLIRQNIKGINTTMIGLEEEIDRLKNYMDLEKMRMGNLFDYNFQIDENVEKEEVKIPSMIIQPFVENSILHGISPLNGGGLINISLSMVSEWAVRITVEDNGIGMEQSKTLRANDGSHLHLSMEMTRKRIEILGKKYGVETSLEVTEAFPGNNNPGTKVTVVLPVSYAEGDQ